MGETLLLHATRYGYVQQSIFDAATTQIASQQQQQQQCLKCCCVIYVQQDRDKLKEITMCSVKHVDVLGQPLPALATSIVYCCRTRTDA